MNSKINYIYPPSRPGSENKLFYSKIYNTVISPEAIETKKIKFYNILSVIVLNTKSNVNNYEDNEPPRINLNLSNQ